MENQMKIKDNILSESIKQLVSAISAILILLTYSLYSDLIPIIAQQIIPNVSKQVLLKITTLATVLFFLSVVLSFVFYLKLRNKLVPRFGAKWDKSKQPYCPTCESLLTRYSAYKNDDGQIKYFYFYCMKCKESVYIKDESANHLTIQDAQKQL
jgi:hypothetical protein